MINVVNNCIYHTRGDTGTIAFIPSINGAAIAIYTATFTVKKTYEDTTAILQKQFNSGSINLTSEDTKDLAYGEYVYDIEVHFTDSGGTAQVLTFGPYKYYLTPDVTR